MEKISFGKSKNTADHMIRGVLILTLDKDTSSFFRSQMNSV